MRCPSCMVRKLLVMLSLPSPPWFAKALANGVTSKHKLKTWVYLHLRLAWPCVDLRWLALTLVEINFSRKSMQIFSPFGHPTQPNASWVTSINQLLTMEMQEISDLNGFFATCVYLWGNLPIRLATQRKSLRKFNLPLRATTCESIWPGLKTPCCCFAEDGKEM